MDNTHILILHNVRSTYNVGAIFRTADAIGIREIVLCGITPTPLDRFGRKVQSIAKTALGAENSVLWRHGETTESAIQEARGRGFSIVALEQAPYAIDYKKFSVTNSTALVIGTEVEGIAPEILSLCDHIIEIPMKGEKESLNVSVAVGVVLFRLFDCE